MFELYRETPEGAEPAEGVEPDANVEGAKWRWQITSGDKVLARSEESWTKRSAALTAVRKFRETVANAGVVEKLV